MLPVHRWADVHRSPVADPFIFVYHIFDNHMFEKYPVSGQPSSKIDIKRLVR
jgi:hypothetical protein